MSNNESPINAPAPPALPPKHHLQKGEEKRIRLAGGPWVDAHTLASLHEWQKRDISYGELIDRLVILAEELGYDPVFQLYKKQTKSQKAGLAR